MGHYDDVRDNIEKRADKATTAAATTVNYDVVERPAHYNAGTVEAIDAIRSALGDDAFAAYCRGNALKYLWRAGLKGPAAEDVRKARWYLAMALFATGDGPDPRTYREGK
jgi:hypothetical protein